MISGICIFNLSSWKKDFETICSIYGVNFNACRQISKWIIWNVNAKKIYFLFITLVLVNTIINIIFRKRMVITLYTFLILIRIQKLSLCKIDNKHETCKYTCVLSKQRNYSGILFTSTSQLEFKMKICLFHQFFFKWAFCYYLLL